MMKIVQKKGGDTTPPGRAGTSRGERQSGAVIPISERTGRRKNGWKVGKAGGGNPPNIYSRKGGKLTI